MIILGRSFFSTKAKQTYTLMGLRNHTTFQDKNRDQRLSNKFRRFFVIYWKFGNCEECRLLGVTVRLEFHLFYSKFISHYVNRSKHFSKPNWNWNTSFFPRLTDNAVSTVSNDGQKILKFFQKIPLCPNFNVAMASRLIQGQTKTLDNNVSFEMSFLWGAIFASWYF